MCHIEQQIEPLERQSLEKPAMPKKWIWKLLESWTEEPGVHGPVRDSANDNSVTEAAQALFARCHRASAEGVQGYTETDYPMQWDEPGYNYIRART